MIVKGWNSTHKNDTRYLVRLLCPLGIEKGATMAYGLLYMAFFLGTHVAHVGATINKFNAWFR